MGAWLSAPLEAAVASDEAMLEPPDGGSAVETDHERLPGAQLAPLVAPWLLGAASWPRPDSWRSRALALWATPWVAHVCPEVAARLMAFPILPFAPSA